jgi:hypothetical protein
MSGNTVEKLVFDEWRIQKVGAEVMYVGCRHVVRDKKIKNHGQEARKPGSQERKARFRVDVCLESTKPEP